MLKTSTCAVVAALSICFLAAPPLSAATIFNFSGTVDRIDGSSAEALYTIGDLVTGSVVMDATAEPISSYVSRSLYGADAYLSASLFLNGAPAFSSVAYNSFIWVERSETHGDDVLFDVIQNQAISKPITEYLAIPGISIGYFAMRLAGPPGTLPDFTLNANWNLSDFTEGFWEVL